MKLIRTWVNDDEAVRIQEYCNQRGISVYRLVKDSVFEYMARNPAQEPEERG